MKTLVIPARAKKSILPVVRASLKKLDCKRVGLASTIQFSDQLGEAKKLLESKGFSVVLSKSKKRGGQGIKATEDGQVLGCDATLTRVAKADCWLYIGTGQFHPLAIAFETNKPVIILNPFTKKISSISDKEKQRWLAMRAARLSKLKTAKNVGIILSNKPGQTKPKIPGLIEKKLKGKKCFLFTCDLVQPNELLNFPQIDVWVNTACPRLVEDKFPKTVVNADWVLSEDF